jgi:K+-sensing histidine kinase KdpD
MGAGVPPGLQNQSRGVSSVLGGFDSHIFPPNKEIIMHKNVLVCVTQQKTCEKLIRTGAELSSQDENNNLFVIHVVNENDKFLYNLSDGDALEYLFEITKEIGADLVVRRSKNVIKTIVDFANEEKITHIVLGNSLDTDPAKNFVSRLKRKLVGKEFIVKV